MSDVVQHFPRLWRFSLNADKVIINLVNVNKSTINNFSSQVPILIITIRRTWFKKYHGNGIYVSLTTIFGNQRIKGFGEKGKWNIGTKNCVQPP